ncbi:MAG: class I SAM-dependent methyltransferase [Myxococcota bacterium]
MFTTRQSCRVCGSTSLTPVLSLGEQHIASNFFMSADYPPPRRRVPLELVRCSRHLDEKACGFLQLRHTVHPDLLYSSYGYRSGINRTMTVHLQKLAAEVEAQVRPGPEDVVIDIGASDGTLLLGYQARGVAYVGFEPSNIVPPEPIPHVRFIRDYFSAASFRAVMGNRKARIISSVAMFYDIDRPHDFVADIASLLHQDGVWVLELSYMPTMLEKTSFDTICHEHLGYYSLDVLERLLEPHGLKVADAELNDSNGGSIRLFVTHRTSGYAPRDGARARLHKLRVLEFDLKLDMDEPYVAFAERVYQVRAELQVLLQGLKARGKRIHGYGASTKGNVILQFCKLGPDLVEAIADRNPAKWGTRTVGSDIPIISEDEMRAAKPDYLLVLPYHFLPEFKEREKALTERGGQLIVPIPRPEVVA